MALDLNWERVKDNLRAEIGEVAYESWVKPISLGNVKEGIATLFVPTKFMQDWIERHYASVIKKTLVLQEPEITEISFSVRPAMMQQPSHPAKEIASVSPVASCELDLPSSSNRFSPEAGSSGNDLFSFYLDNRFTFDQFIVGSSNEFAYAASLKVAQSRSVVFNPLYLYSSVGLGKTHLMHAIAWKIKETDPSRQVVYLSAEKFMYNFINALRYKDIMSFKEKFRSIDVLMIDDVQFLTGKDTTQKEFSQTFNALVDQGKQLILSADKPPQGLLSMDERLKTRMSSGLVADITATDFGLRVGILQAKADFLGVNVPKEVIEFLADRIVTNVRELEGALKRVVGYSQLVGGDISLERTKEVLKDTLVIYDKKITIDDIQRKVSEHFKIKVSEMQSKRREREVARPRQIAMYLAKQLTTRSLPEIGRKFDRDHTTVIHAVKTIEDLQKSNPTIAEDVDFLKRALAF